MYSLYMYIFYVLLLHSACLAAAAAVQGNVLELAETQAWCLLSGALVVLRWYLGDQGVHAHVLWVQMREAVMCEAQIGCANE